MAKEKEARTIVKEVLSQILPTKAEEKELKSLSKNVLSKLKIPQTKAVLGGSGAKNTWLPSSKEIDIYVRFNYKKYQDKSQDLSDILHKHLKKKWKQVERLHGSRDYFQVKEKEYTVEIVPILEIKKAREAKNITDFSFFHINHVKKKIKEKLSLANEVRVAKAFLKAQNLYGAESYIKGFSGYATELLVIKYGSFLKLLKAVSQWKKTTVIGSKKAAEDLNWAKKLSPLHLIDPTDNTRNAAAAVSNEQYQKFIKVAKAFLKKPSMNHFEKQAVDLNKLKKKGHLSIIKATPLKKKKDVAGAKALKAFNFLCKQLEEYEIKESHFDYTNEEVIFYIVTRKNKLSETKRQEGPPITNKEAVNIFKKKHKTVKIDRKIKKYYTIKKRKENKLKESIKAALSQDEVINRVKNIMLFNK